MGGWGTRRASIAPRRRSATRFCGRALQPGGRLKSLPEVPGATVPARSLVERRLRELEGPQGCRLLQPRRAAEGELIETEWNARRFELAALQAPARAAWRWPNEDLPQPCLRSVCPMPLAHRGFRNQPHPGPATRSAVPGGVWFDGLPASSTLASTESREPASRPAIRRLMANG